MDIDDADARKFAIDVLAQLPAYDAVDRIAARLDDPDTNVRLAAIDALASLGATEYAPVLRERYRFYPAERPHILAALGTFRDARGLQLVEAALNDPDPVVQYAAAEALARYPIPEVLHLLLRQVEQATPEARPLVLYDLIEAYESATGPVPPLPEWLRPYLLEMLQEPDLSFKKKRPCVACATCSTRRPSRPCWSMRGSTTSWTWPCSRPSPPIPGRSPVWPAAPKRAGCRSTRPPALPSHS
ncbi:HEAT repeat domain-containing protein [Rhodothermus marinus]|uniref:HEAT repeat domain-containing protein n=1 Tax=Rhodothermus marinus TaxID=29549 RepID=UPI001FB46472|nr:HEAT repeat domain-containing protein [Rhodothermus marinus]